MLYDATKCVGCKACMAACKRVNAGPGGLAFEQARFDQDGLWDAPEDLSGNTRTLIKLFKDTKGWSYIKYSCMHCQKPSCVSVCPVSAMTKDPVTGIVDYSKDTCIGCRYCQVACPFNIPKFQWDRTLPQIVKCDLCRDTNLKDKGIPACAETCPAGAILFGKREELLAEARTRLQQHPERYVPHIYGEHEIGGTNHLYLAALPFDRLGLARAPVRRPGLVLGADPAHHLQGLHRTRRALRLALLHRRPEPEEGRSAACARRRPQRRKHRRWATTNSKSRKAGFSPRPSSSCWLSP